VTEFDRAAERAARLSVIRIADSRPNYELFHDVTFLSIAAGAAALALSRAIPLAPVAAADPCVIYSDVEQAVPVRCDRAPRCWAPLTSTKGVVALFAYACDTLSRPEGIIDHTVDNPPRDLERWENESAECAARAGPESGTARWANFATPASSLVLRWRRLSMGGGSRLGRFAAVKGRFTVGRFPMRPCDGAAPIPSFRLRRFLGR
jgi:hypothetical protein